MKKILHIFMVLFLVGCYSPNKLKEIKYEEIFKVIEKRYIVLFYSSSCKACLNTLELLNKRIEKEKYRGFSVKTGDLEIKYISQKNTNIGVNNYCDIKLSTLPYLIFIEEKTISKELFGYSQIHKENLYIFFE